MHIAATISSKRSGVIGLGLALLAAFFVLAVSGNTARAAQPGFVFPGGCCFYNGQAVRTVVPPATMSRPGTDNFYGGFNVAAAGQKGVVAVAPGDTDYHGGKWAFHSVTWSVTPYPRG